MDAPALQYVTTPDGYGIAYTVCGEGPPLLFMPHPLSHTHLYWRSRNVFSLLYGHLAGRFRLICYDSRGQGSSQRGLPESFRIEDWETDLQAVIDHLRLEHFVLLAQSGFDRIAIRYAANHPDRVDALVLWNPDTGDASLDGWDPAQIESVVRSNWDLFIDLMARTGWAEEKFEVAKHLLRESTTQADTIITVRAWQHYKITDIVSKVRVPTLLLASANGAFSYSTEDASRYIASHIPGARLELFDNVGAGLFYLSSEVPAGVLLIDEMIKGLAPRAESPQREAIADGLSSREIEVLRLLAAGRSNQQIADELVISLNTVRRHVSNIFDKTGAANRAQATAYAKDHGIA
jgi:DNA-binding NarL/FixJ family response regulator